MLKLCKRCNTTKPLTEFHPSKKQIYQFYCKQCAMSINNERQKALSAAKKAKRLEEKQALIDAGLQYCSKCKQTLSINDFHRGNAYWKSCKGAIDKKYQMDKNQHPYTYTKVCPNCNLNKSLDLFYPSSSSADGKQSYCKKCSRENEKKHAEIKRIERQLRKKETQSQFNTTGYFEAIRGGKENAGRPIVGDLELTPTRIEFLNLQRQHWRQVFNERHDDIMVLMKAYEADPEQSLHLVTEFHNNVRPNWKLEHKTIKQTKDEYYEFLRNKHNSPNIG